MGVSLPTLAGEQATKRYRLAQSHVDEMVTAARRAYPQEACGVLMAPQGQEPIFWEAQNVAKEPEHQFSLDGRTMSRIKKFCTRYGGSLEAIWHSHPNGRLGLSPGDIQAASSAGRPYYPGVIYLVVGLVRVGHPEYVSVVGYLWQDGAFRQVEIELYG